MGRNLVKEAEDKIKPAVEEEATDTKPDEKVVYITTEQVTLNNLNFIMAQLNEIHNKMLEGFKAVGVKFEDKKD